MLQQWLSYLGVIAGHWGLWLMAGVCAFALLKGGTPERAGAALVALAWLGLIAAQALTGEMVPEIPFVVSDILLALGFLGLAIRYASLWLGAEMILEAALFFLHGSHLSEHPGRSYGYLASVNAVSGGVLAILLGATIVAWTKRAGMRRALATRRDSAPPGNLTLGGT